MPQLDRRKDNLSGLVAWVSIGLVAAAQVVSTAYFVGGLKQQVADLSRDIKEIKCELSPKCSPSNIEDTNLKNKEKGGKNASIRTINSASDNR